MLPRQRNSANEYTCISNKHILLEPDAGRIDCDLYFLDILIFFSSLLVLLNTFFLIVEFYLVLLKL